jgi:ribonuclease HI
MSEPISTLLVLYTDGSCQPSSRGFAGSGIHGYMCFNPFKYPPKQGAGAKQIPTMDGYIPNQDKLITDHSVVLNVESLIDMPPTWEEFKRSVEIDYYIDWWQAIEGESTSNVGELKGALKALQIVIEKKPERARILLDSQYTLTGLNEYVEKWKARGWKKSDGTTPENVEWWIQLDETYAKAKEVCPDLQLVKVAGHSGEVGNHAADIAANRASIRSRLGRYEEVYKETPGKGYWSYKSEHNRLLSKAHLYFNCDTTKDTVFNQIDTPVGVRYVYFTGDEGSEDTLFGKRMSNTSFSVLLLEHPEEIVSIVYDKQKEVVTPGSSPFTFVKLSALVNPRHAHEIREHNGDYLYVRIGDEELCLHTPDKTKITTIPLKPHITYAGAAELLDIQSILMESLPFFTQEKTDTYLRQNNLIATEITDMLYEPLEKKGEVVGVKLRKEFTVSSKLINTPVYYTTGREVKSVKHKFLFDLDLPNRNMLAALAELNCRVLLVTWMESDCSFRYATVLQHGNDYGIWCSAYSNLRFVK